MCRVKNAKISMGINKYLLVIAVAIALVGCGGSSWNDDMNIFEQAAEAYANATERILNANSMSEINDAVSDLKDEIKDIEESDEIKHIKSLYESDETAAIEEYKESWRQVKDAATKYADALMDKCMALGE